MPATIAPALGPRSAVDPSGQYLLAAHCIRRYKPGALSNTKLYRLAATGIVSVRLLPGSKPLYCVADLDRVMGGREGD